LRFHFDAEQGNPMNAVEIQPRTLQRFDIADAFDDVMAAVDADGSAIVERFVSADLLARLNAEMDAPIEQRPSGSGNVGAMMAMFWGQQTKRFTRLAAIVPSFVELIDSDFMHRWAARDLKYGYWLNTGQAMIVGPGQPEQFLHRDIAIWPYIQDAGLAAPQAMVSALIALSDFTAEVGATRVIPGSHKWEDFHRTPDPADTVQAVMPAGSAVLYLGKTVHAAGANLTTDQWRRGLHISFCLSWLTPEEANPISVPWEIARTYSPRVQRMLGYGSTAHREGRAPTNWLVDFEDVRNYLGVPYQRL
jgi:ectoine hydroxylase-related dioxygenase (phytanoyl-CoA dioxygenase family)